MLALCSFLIRSGLHYGGRNLCETKVRTGLERYSEEACLEPANLAPLISSSMSIRRGGKQLPYSESPLSNSGISSIPWLLTGCADSEMCLRRSRTVSKQDAPLRLHIRVRDGPAMTLNCPKHQRLDLSSRAIGYGCE